MDLTIIASAPHQIRCAEAVAAGLRKTGGRATIVRGMAPGGIHTNKVAVWGWRNGKRFAQRGHDVLVMERGYLGDRFRWYSLGWGGLNGRARFYPRLDGGERFLDHHGALVKPWRCGGDYVLLIGQMPTDVSLQGKNIEPWYQQSTRAAALAYKLPVRFRPHPQLAVYGLKSKTPPGAELIGGTLHEALAGAAVCVTWNSNTAVDAVLAGVPTVAMDEGSMAYPVTGHKIGDLLICEREYWAYRLAWCQFLLSEIAEGLPFECMEPANAT